MSKKLSLVATSLVVLLMAGCSRESAPADATGPGEVADGTSEPADAAAAATTAPCPEPIYSALPDGVQLDREYYVRTDRVYVTRAGGERRRTSLEILEGDPAAIAEQLVADLVSQGFRQMDIADKGDGITRYAVRKRGVGRINLSATEDLGGNPAHPRSVGIVAFDWPLTAGDEDDGSEGEAAAEAADAQPGADPAG